MAKVGKRTAKIQANTSPELKERIKRLAAEFETSESIIASNLIETGLNLYDREPFKFED